MVGNEFKLSKNNGLQIQKLITNAKVRHDHDLQVFNERQIEHKERNRGLLMNKELRLRRSLLFLLLMQN